MKIQNLLSGLVLAVIIVTVSACQSDGDSLSMKQAQLVGNENLLLKKEIQKKDAELASLRQQLEQTRQERQALQTQSEQLDKNLKQQQEENIQLKEEVEKKGLEIASLHQQLNVMSEENIQSQNVKMIESLMTQLDQYKQRLSKYEPVPDVDNPAPQQ